MLGGRYPQPQRRRYGQIGANAVAGLAGLSDLSPQQTYIPGEFLDSAHPCDLPLSRIVADGHVIEEGRPESVRVSSRRLVNFFE